MFQPSSATRPDRAPLDESSPSPYGGRMISRRMKTIALAAALTAVCLSITTLNVHGQPQGRTYRVGVLLFSSPTVDPNMPVFREALRAAGYVEGRNLTLEFRYAEGKPERLKALAHRERERGAQLCAAAAFPGGGFPISVNGSIHRGAFLQ